MMQIICQQILKSEKDGDQEPEETVTFPEYRLIVSS